MTPKRKARTRKRKSPLIPLLAAIGVVGFCVGIVTGTRRPASDGATEAQWKMILGVFENAKVESPPATAVMKRRKWKLVTLPEQKAQYLQAIAGWAYYSVFDETDPLKRSQQIRETIAAADVTEGHVFGCLPGMVRVKGTPRDWRSTRKRQHARGACLDSLEWKSGDLCNRFNPEMLKASESPAAAPMDFCIDRYEFPNIPLEYPATVTTFHEGERICKAQGKRLCTEDEWTFACEGPEALPYPHGYNRYLTPGASYPKNPVKGMECNVDNGLNNIDYKESRLTPRYGAAATSQMDLIWFGEASGARMGCVSWAGAYDMTGNIDEWTVHSPGRDFEGHKSINKGGHFGGAVRGRCQPSTVSHDEDYFHYATGFRCCASAPAN